MKKTIIIKTIATAMLLTTSAANTLAEKTTVASPNGRLVVTAEDTDGRLFYAVDYDGKRRVEPSVLGVESNIGDFTKQLKYKSAATQRVSKKYAMRTTKTSSVDYEANQLSLVYTDAKGTPMKVIFNVSDNDVAFCYSFERKGDNRHIIINKEHTAFNLPQHTTSRHSRTR